MTWLLAAASTPLPVIVHSIPPVHISTMPGIHVLSLPSPKPDGVALATLEYAKRAFWVATFAFIIAVAEFFYVAQQFRLERTQFNEFLRRPVIELEIIRQYIEPELLQLGRLVGFSYAVQNRGDKAATSVLLEVAVPGEDFLDTAGVATTIDNKSYNLFTFSQTSGASFLTAGTLYPKGQPFQYSQKLLLRTDIMETRLLWRVFDSVGVYPNVDGGYATFKFRTKFAEYKDRKS